MWVKIITKMALKEKFVGGVEWWRDADDYICLIRFLIFSVPWSVPGKDMIFIFRLRLVFPSWNFYHQQHDA